ncbi:hypothetical protein GCM10009087_15630 [Sphingomonas oligophenolica]
MFGDAGSPEIVANRSVGKDEIVVPHRVRGGNFVTLHIKGRAMYTFRFARST